MMVAKLKAGTFILGFGMAIVALCLATNANAKSTKLLDPTATEPADIEYVSDLHTIRFRSQ